MDIKSAKKETPCLTGPRQRLSPETRQHKVWCAFENPVDVVAGLQ